MPVGAIHQRMLGDRKVILANLISTVYDAGMVKRRTVRVSDQLRQIIDNCGVSRYEISKRTGIAESTLSKFMCGERGLSMKALDKLGQCLGLTVNMGQKPSRPRRK